MSFPSGTIASPGFPADPNYYDNNVDCVWNFEAPANQNIILQFNNFTTEPGRDTVTVLDKNFEKQILLLDLLMIN